MQSASVLASSTKSEDRAQVGLDPKNIVVGEIPSPMFSVDAGRLRSGSVTDSKGKFEIGELCGKGIILQCKGVAGVRTYPVTVSICELELIVETLKRLDPALSAAKHLHLIENDITNYGMPDIVRVIRYHYGYISSDDCLRIYAREVKPLIAKLREADVIAKQELIDLGFRNRVKSVPDHLKTKNCAA